jgi:hypothetical protein
MEITGNRGNNKNITNTGFNNMRRVSPSKYPAKHLVTDPAALPPPGMRWTAQRKAAVVIAIRGGLLERNEACDRYMLSDRELREWEQIFNHEGTLGLLVKKSEAKRRDRPRSKKS